MDDTLRLDLVSPLPNSHGRIERNARIDASFPLHTHTFYEYFLVTRGHAEHRVNGVCQSVSRGMLLFIRPSDIHRFEPSGGGEFETLYVTVPEAEFLRAAEYLNIPDAAFTLAPLPLAVTLAPGDFACLEGLLARLPERRDYDPEDSLFRAALCAALSMVSGTGDAGLRLPDWLVALLRKMHRPENFVPGLPRLLELSNYSREHVNRAFRRYLNITPTAYINSLRLDHAFVLLGETQLSVSEIAARCGFGNMSHFYALFGARFGCTPKECTRYAANRNAPDGDT